MVFIIFFHNNRWWKFLACLFFGPCLAWAASNVHVVAASPGLSGRVFPLLFHVLFHQRALAAETECLLTSANLSSSCRGELRRRRRGEEGMSLLDVELGPRSAEDRGLAFCGTARTTLWFQCKYGRSTFCFPSTEPAVWSFPIEFLACAGNVLCIACAICCLPPRRSWHSCVELFIICLFVCLF